MQVFNMPKGFIPGQKFLAPPLFVNLKLDALVRQSTDTGSMVRTTMFKTGLRILYKYQGGVPSICNAVMICLPVQEEMKMFLEAKSVVSDHNCQAYRSGTAFAL